MILGLDTEAISEASKERRITTESVRKWDSTCNRRSVWTVPAKGFKGAHFAVFPLNLIRPCVLAGCPVGGTVLDPFFGSGTTGIAATIYGRGYIGIDLNPSYLEMAKKRLARVEKNMAKDTYA